jgi:hypothetical protein
MKTKEVKLNVEYRFKNEIVKVVKRNKNSWVEKWQIGWGKKTQRIRHQEQTSFLLDNGHVAYADSLSVV